MRNLISLALTFIAALIASLAVGARTLPHRQYIPAPGQSDNDTVTVAFDDSAPASRTSVEVGGRFFGRMSGHGVLDNGLSLRFSNGYSLSLRPGSTDFGHTDDQRFMRVLLLLADSIVASTDAFNLFGFRRGEYWMLAVTFDGRKITVEGGSSGISHILTHYTPTPAVQPLSVAITSSGRFDIDYAVCETLPVVVADAPEDFSIDALREYFASSDDNRQGFWEYLDRENEPSLALPGGQYRLAVVSDGNGGYDILYLSGAVTNSGRWKPGMIKGRLRPTIFVDHFSLEWYDAMQQRVDEETNGWFDANRSILTLEFPERNSRLRFSRAQ